MSLVGLVEKLTTGGVPDTKAELTDYILKHYTHVKEALTSNPQYRSNLEGAIDGALSKYSGYLKSPWKRATGTVSAAGQGIGFLADEWFLSTGDIVGSLGGKFLHLLAQIPEKTYGLVYGIKTGNYLSAARNLLQGLLSYVPGLTFVDTGLKGIILHDMVGEAVRTFEKDVNIYIPWTARIKGAIENNYKTPVKDRMATGHVIPAYQPALSPAYAYARV